MTDNKNATGGHDPAPPDPGVKHDGGLDPYPPNPGAAPIGWQRHLILVGALLGVAFVGARTSPLFVASGTALAVSAWLAMTLAARDARHRPVAAALVFMLATMLLRGLLGTTALAAPGPYTGLHRVAFHLEQAAYIGSALVPAWLALRVMEPRRSFGRFDVLVWLSAWVPLVLGYPEFRQDALRQYYLSVELASLLVAVGACVSWVRRRGWVSRISPNVDHAINNLERAMGDTARIDVRTAFEGISTGAAPRWYTVSVVLMLVVGDLALLGVGAWRYGLFWLAYTLQQAGLLALYLSVVVVQTVALALGRRR